MRRQPPRAPSAIPLRHPRARPEIRCGRPGGTARSLPDTLPGRRGELRWRGWWRRRSPHSWQDCRRGGASLRAADRKQSCRHRSPRQTDPSAPVRAWRSCPDRSASLRSPSCRAKSPRPSPRGQLPSLRPGRRPSRRPAPASRLRAHRGNRARTLTQVARRFPVCIR